MSGLPPVCSFWFGELNYLERVCIASFVEKGHPFALYAYGEVGPLPPGCTLRDAEPVIPRAEMFFYKRNRTPAVFADLFRLELMRRDAGVWVDCDVYCVRPFADLPDYVFGAEATHGGVPQINNAVFRCPAECQLLDALFAVFRSPDLPPGLPFWRRWEVRLRRALGERLPVHEMQFGATGPWPLNHHVRRLGLERFIQPEPVFYPVPYGGANVLLEPGSGLDDIVRPETLGLHLWRSALTRRGSGTLPEPHPASFFAAERARLGV